MKKAGVIALLVLVFTGAGFFWWNQGSAERAEEKMELAVKYVSENDFEKAILAYNDAIKIDPKATDAYQGLAKVHTMQGDYEKAQSVYEQGLAAVAAKDQPVLQLGLAGMYIDKGDMDQAEKSFQNLIQKDRTCLEAHWGLAMLYQQQGNNEQAETTLKQAIENNPDQYRAYNFLALYLSQNGQSDQAFDQLVKSLSLEVNQQEAYLVLTDLYKTNWSQLLDKLAGISDQKTAAMLEFYSYYAAEDYYNAVNLFETKLSGQTNNHKAQILAAIAMTKMGQASQGQDLIAQLADQEVDTWLLSDIAEYYLAAGDKQKARYTAINALEAHSTNLEAVAILQRLNMNDEAGQIYAAQYLLYNWKPVSEVEDTLAKSELKLPFTTPKASVISFIKEEFPEIQEFELEYCDMKRADLTGDEQAEIIITTGSSSCPAIVLQPLDNSYRVLYKDDGSYGTSWGKPEIDKYGNVVLSFANNGTGTIVQSGVILRWDGQSLREIWSGIIQKTNYMEIAGSQWFEENGSFTISGNKRPEKLKYVMHGQYGHVEEFGVYDIKDRETTITEVYTFDENQFRFVETSSDTQETVKDEKLALLQDAAEWAQAETGEVYKLEPPYGDPAPLDYVLCAKEISGDTALVSMGEWQTGDAGLISFKRDSSGKWVFDYRVDMSIYEEEPLLP